MDRLTRIIVLGMIGGLLLFGGFAVLTSAGITPLGIPFNNFFSVFGVIIFFITSFFFLSLKTAQP